METASHPDDDILLVALDDVREAAGRFQSTDGAQPVTAEERERVIEEWRRLQRASG